MIQKSVNKSLEYSMESPRQKIIFVGDSGVGKTAMIKNINEEPYMDLHESSIGIDFYPKKIIYKGIEIRLQIWDTAGQEKYKGLIPGYIRNTALVFLVYDISSKESFQHLNEWIEFIKSLENVKIVLCGNKIDLENERQVTKKEGEDFSKERNMVFHEVSAKENINMVKMFYRCMAELPYFDDKIDDNQISREILYKELTRIGYHVVEPGGTFYMFPRTPISDANEFCWKAAKEYNLIIVPGDSFNCPGHFRISYCVTTDMVEKSIPLFEKLYLPQ